MMAGQFPGCGGMNPESSATVANPGANPRSEVS
jgi:hypothetical protein